MSDYNQYQAPSSQVDGATAEQYAEVKLFGVNGRLGRVRYIAYSVGVNFLLLVVISILTAALRTAMGESGTIIGAILMFSAYLFVLVYSVMLGIRRAHDFNVTGWLSVLIFVPLINLIFLLVPGTQGANDFGAPPPPNSTGNVILALVMPVIAVIGILAAIAVPAYNGYVQRAHELQQHQQTQQQR